MEFYEKLMSSRVLIMEFLKKMYWIKKVIDINDILYVCINLINKWYILEIKFNLDMIIWDLKLG